MSQDLLDGVGQAAFEVFEEEGLLVGVLIHQPDEVGGGVAGGFVAGNREGLEELGDLGLGELATVDFAVEVLRNEGVVRCVLTGLDDVIEQEEQVDLVLEEVLVVLEARRGVAQLHVLALALRRDPHHLAKQNHRQLGRHIEHELDTVAFGHLGDDSRRLLANVGLPWRSLPEG